MRRDYSRPAKHFELAGLPVVLMRVVGEACGQATAMEAQGHGAEQESDAFQRPVHECRFDRWAERERRYHEKERHDEQPSREQPRVNGSRNLRHPGRGQRHRTGRTRTRNSTGRG